jgi:plastocyanin
MSEAVHRQDVFAFAGVALVDEHLEVDVGRHAGPHGDVAEHHPVIPVGPRACLRTTEWHRNQRAYHREERAARVAACLSIVWSGHVDLLRAPNRRRDRFVLLERTREFEAKRFTETLSRAVTHDGARKRRSAIPAAGAVANSAGSLDLTPAPPGGTAVAAECPGVVRWQEVAMKQKGRAAVLAVLVAGAVASSCGGGGGGYSAPTAANPPAATTGGDPAATVVGILGDRGAGSFAPNPLTTRTGQKVQWRNQDGTLHRIVQDRAGDDGNNSGDPYGPGQGNSPASGFDGGDTPPGGTSNTMTLGVAGTFHYHCAIHPGMVGSIVVQ